MEPKIKCVHCGSTEHRKEGKRKTENRGKIQKYHCKTCDRYFTQDEGFYRMRHNPKTITMSIDMYLSNLSSRKMRNQLKRHFDLKVSHISVLDWVRRYTLKVQKYVDTLKPKLSGRIYADETEIPRSQRKDGKNDIFWCSVDWGTRYINATLYSPHQQNMNDATEFMFRIKKSKSVPKYVQTDAAGFYPRAFKNAFYSNKGTREDQPQHIVNNVSKTGRHNVRIETVFSKIKDRVYDFRGLKALWSAPIIMVGLIIQHNHIEPHTTTRKLPSELAGINTTEGNNQWLKLIKRAVS